jgi:hypothetical protein
MKHFSALLFVLIFSLPIVANSSTNRVSREEYIEAYKDLALKEMKRVGIPASITLAQGILESDCGNSRLARKSNNHFGIKCHSDWKGKKVYHDDDKRNECFRSYKKVYDSYIDHSEFLVGKSRYASLFELKTTDYKGWAKGLKKAGYATDPHYARRLIKIIEESRLYELDRNGDWTQPVSSQSQRRNVDDFVIDPYNSHAVKYNNGVKYITLEEGDTFEAISEEFGFRDWEVFHYNDIPETADIDEYKYLYVEAKRRRAHKNHEYHVVKEGETLQWIAHKYGMKLRNLRRFNGLDENQTVEAGDRLNLRRKKR